MTVNVALLDALLRDCNKTNFIKGTTVDIITNKMREDLGDFGSIEDVTDTWNSVQVREAT